MKKISKKRLLAAITLPLILVLALPNASFAAESTTEVTTSLEPVVDPMKEVQAPAPTEQAQPEAETAPQSEVKATVEAGAPASETVQSAVAVQYNPTVVFGKSAYAPGERAEVAACGFEPGAAIDILTNNGRDASSSTGEIGANGCVDTSPFRITTYAFDGSTIRFAVTLVDGGQQFQGTAIVKRIVAVESSTVYTSLSDTVPNRVTDNDILDPTREYTLVTDGLVRQFDGFGVGAVIGSVKMDAENLTFTDTRDAAYWYPRQYGSFTYKQCLTEDLTVCSNTETVSVNTPYTGENVSTPWTLPTVFRPCSATEDDYSALIAGYNAQPIGFRSPAFSRIIPGTKVTINIDPNGFSRDVIGDVAPVTLTADANGDVAPYTWSSGKTMGDLSPDQQDVLTRYWSPTNNNGSSLNGYSFDFEHESYVDDTPTEPRFNGAIFSTRSSWFPLSDTSGPCVAAADDTAKSERVDAVTISVLANDRFLDLATSNAKVSLGDIPDGVTARVLDDRTVSVTASNSFKGDVVDVPYTLTDVTGKSVATIRVTLAEKPPVIVPLVTEPPAVVPPVVVPPTTTPKPPIVTIPTTPKVTDPAPTTAKHIPNAGGAPIIWILLGLGSIGAGIGLAFKKGGVVLAATAVAFSTLTACGTAQTVPAATPGVIQEKTARCVAKIFLDSDLSAEWLNEYVAGNKAYVASKADAKALKEANTKIWKECAE